MLSSWPISVLHCIPLMHPSHSYQISSYMATTTYLDMKTQLRNSNWSKCFLPCILRTVQFSPLSLLHLPRSILPSSYPYQKGQPALPAKILSLENLSNLFNNLAVPEITQSNSERKVNNLGGGSISHCEKKSSYELVFDGRCLNVQIHTVVNGNKESEITYC